MDRTEIVNKIKTIIADQFGLTEDEVLEKNNFQTDLDADSLDAVEIIMTTEDVFNINIPDKDADNIFTVKGLADYISKKLEK